MSETDQPQVPNTEPDVEYIRCEKCLGTGTRSRFPAGGASGLRPWTEPSFPVGHAIVLRPCASCGGLGHFRTQQDSEQSRKEG